MGVILKAQQQKSNIAKSELTIIISDLYCCSEVGSQDRIPTGIREDSTKALRILIDVVVLSGYIKGPWGHSSRERQDHAHNSRIVSWSYENN